jgi:hypothetical protein
MTHKTQHYIGISDTSHSFASKQYRILYNSIALELHQINGCSLQLQYFRMRTHYILHITSKIEQIQANITIIIISPCFLKLTLILLLSHSSVIESLRLFILVLYIPHMQSLDAELMPTLILIRLRTISQSVTQETREQNQT